MGTTFSEESLQEFHVCPRFGTGRLGGDLSLEWRVIRCDSLGWTLSNYGSASGTRYSAPDGLLQLRVLRFGLLQDGNVGIGVFPKGKEIFVGGKRPSAGSIGVHSLRSS